MTLALMLAAYVAARFSPDEAEPVPWKRRRTAAYHEPAALTGDDPDCMLGAEAWVALPPTCMLCPPPCGTGPASPAARQAGGRRARKVSGGWGHP